MKKIGIIGGGQLGMMMAEAAHQLGFQVIVLDPTPLCPCGQIAEEQIIANYDDVIKIEELCQKTDVVTYEFENIPYSSVKELKTKYNIPQGELPLFLSQHRLREKKAAVEAGIKCSDYFSVNSVFGLSRAIKAIGYPSVLKSCSGGYDGKGQVVLHSAAQLPEAVILSASSECMLEKFIPFDCEISVIVTRSIHGEISTLPVSQNIHKDNILFMSIIPASISENVLKKADEMARKMMLHLGFVGTLAIELFVVGDDVLFNEMAPRPHNSGHYSIEGCVTSQFEQHIRAITGMPLGSTTLKQQTIMVNYLGQHIEGIKKLREADLPSIFIHDYGKVEAKHNRKMGHVTFLNYTKEEVSDLLRFFRV